MKPLYTQEELNKAKSNDLLPCECYQCKKPFLKKKMVIQSILNPNSKSTGKYCSRECHSLSMNTKVNYNCHNCGKECITKKGRLNSSKNKFCSHYCSSFYYSQNRITGNNRSKLEIWLEEQLTLLYPKLHIDYNKTSAIQAELDIYIPSLNLAFELNGIFHYEPIFGVNKLEKTQINDQNKFKKCIDNKIDLCIIDTTSQKYFKPDNSKKFLDIINNIVKERLTSLG